MLLAFIALAATSPKSCGRHAELAQPGNAEEGDRLADPGDAVLDCGARVAGQQLRGLRIPGKDRAARLPGPQGAHVRLDRCERRGAGGAVRHVGGCADDTGEPWTAPSFALARAIPPSRLHTAMSPRASSVDAVGVGQPQPGRGAAQPAAREAVGERFAGPRRRVPALGKRVKPAGRGDRRRAGER